MKNKGMFVDYRANIFLLALGKIMAYIIWSILIGSAISGGLFFYLTTKPPDYDPTFLVFLSVIVSLFLTYIAANEFPIFYKAKDYDPEPDCGFSQSERLYGRFEEDCAVDDTVPIIGVTIDYGDNNDNIEKSNPADEYIENAKPKIPEHPVMEHILFYGGAGLGKSALSKVVAREAEGYYGHPIEFIKLSPSQIQNKKQLDEVMLRVVENPYCVLFIDEIHGMKREIEESLYSAIQDREYDITISDTVNLDESVRIKIEQDTGTQTIQLPPYTCIGATTLIGEINKPLKDRFPITIELQPYTEGQLLSSFNGTNSEPMKFSEYIGQEKAKDILVRCFKSLAIKDEPSFSEDAKKSIVDISFGVMRLKKVYAKMASVFAKSEGSNIVTPSHVEILTDLYDIDSNGFGRPHRAILAALVEKHKFTPEGKSYSMSSQSLASMAAVTKSDIDSIYIPILEGLGLIEKDGRQMKRISNKGLVEWQKTN